MDLSQVDFGQVSALVGVLITFWFLSSAPWWAYQLFRDVADTGQPDQRAEP